MEHLRQHGGSLHSCSPAVDSLPVHRPDEQWVMFNPNNAEQALEAATHTKLTAYFSKNCEDQ